MAASAWHWRSLGVKKWAEEWLREQIMPLEAAGLSVTRVETPEGDCEVASRKGRLLTIYDLRVEVRWQASASEGPKIEGVLVCPEMAHDMSLDEYKFEASSDVSSEEAEHFRIAATNDLANELRRIFDVFPQALLEKHGTALRASGDLASNGGSSQISAASKDESWTQNSSVSATSSAALNTSTVRVTSEFQATAETLFDLLTDEAKVPLWSRNPAKVRAEKGAEISLFNGNITGQMISVERPVSFVSTWRAPTWHEGHFGRLHTTFKQGSESTTMELRLEGVPKGEEDITERNLEIFYIRSLKSMGLGGLIGSVAPLSRAHPSTPTADLAGSRAGQVVYGLLPFLFSLFLIVGLASAILLGPSGQSLRGSA